MTLVEIDFSSLQRAEGSHMIEARAGTVMVVTEGLARLSLGRKYPFAEWIPGANAYGMFVEDELTGFLPASAVHAVLTKRSQLVQGYVDASEADVPGRTTRRLDTVLSRLDAVTQSVSATRVNLVDRGWFYRSPDISGVFALRLEIGDAGSFKWMVKGVTHG